MIVKYYEAFKRLSHYKVPTINILQETIENESEDKGEAGALSDIEILSTVSAPVVHRSPKAS